MISLREYILQELTPKLPLYEQAMNRDMFVDKLIDIMPMVLSHWGLIEYAHGDFENNDSYEQYVEHWKNELLAFCNQIITYKIKGGNKKKAVEYALLNNLEVNDFDVIYGLIKSKFNKENISLEDTKKITRYLLDNINELIDALSSKTCYKWIEEL